MPMQEMQEAWVQFPGGGNGNPLMYSCWEIPWTEEPGRLQSLGSQSQRVGHDFVTEHANVHTFKLIYCNLVVQLV